MLYTEFVVDKTFYPRSPRGERRSCSTVPSFLTSFLSTLSARRATNGNLTISRNRFNFLSTLSARRATYTIPGFFPISGLSIHALREESD